MESWGGENAGNKAVWLYPKVAGFCPERWGHSACCSDGVVYVFGGCCGGFHFSDVLTLDLDAMVWATLITSGEGPGTRDSHSAALAGHKMIVFGGSNGFKKVNDFRVLDLRTKGWSRPICKGLPPSPRESHTTTAVGEDKIVVFGGSGEGKGNYLNDIHVLDLRTMTWTSPKVKGDLPERRDSHIAVAIENNLVVYGGDSGDHHLGDVNVLDMGSFTWSKLLVQGSSPGARAGHTAVNIGAKVYIVGGVGDKHYYSDVWVLDLRGRSWTKLELCGYQLRGRFSHSAVVMGSNIVIYGGCGEDEHPLNELLILQLGTVRPTGHCNISLHKIFRNREKQRCIRKMENSVNNHVKKWKAFSPTPGDVMDEEEENFPSLPQYSSTSQSHQDLFIAYKHSSSVSFPIKDALSDAEEQNQSTSQAQHWKRTGQVLHFMGDEHQKQPSSDLLLHAVLSGRSQVQYVPLHQTLPHRSILPNMIGAEVQGKIDGAFDSGYLMTASISGQILRGVLFAPGPSLITRALLPQSSSQTSPISGTCLRPACSDTAHFTLQQQMTTSPKRSMVSSDQQDITLTLGGPDSSLVAHEKTSKDSDRC